MVWGFCVYFVYMIPLETDVLRKHLSKNHMTFSGQKILVSKEMTIRDSAGFKFVQ